MTWFRFSASCAFAVVLAALAACGPQRDQPIEQPPSAAAETEPAAPAEPMPPAGRTATATLQSETAGLGGTVTFTEQAGGGVHVVAEVQGVPAGKHGLHIHETGDCGGEHHSAAGGHFNPANVPHACPPTEPRHAGDFGNVEVGANGVGRMELAATGLSFDGPNSFVGKAIILHGGEDDCKTQPTGNSGDRSACGVIQEASGTAQ
jgi:superoxide dismutase, Cu-Zn family